MTLFCQWSHKIKTIFRRLKLISDFRFTKVIKYNYDHIKLKHFLFRSFKTISDLQTSASVAEIQCLEISWWWFNAHKNIKEAIYKKRKGITHSMGWDVGIWSILKIRCKSVYQYYFEINFFRFYSFIVWSDWKEF